MQNREQKMNDSVEIIDAADVEEEEEYNHQYQQLQERSRPQQSNDNNYMDQLQNLLIDQDPEMERVQITIEHSKIQYDWLIFEQHTYEINTNLNCKNNNLRIVTRRFSDFEWLYQELTFKYPGYILPALPEKGIYSKLEIPYLNKIKSEFMDARKEMLHLFLIGLTTHKELKYTKEVKFFLISPDNQFAEEKERMTNIRQEKDIVSTNNTNGLVRNIFNIGIGAITAAVGQSNVERRRVTDVDEQFEAYQMYYQKQYNKLKELTECFTKIFDARKKQAENFQNVSEIFKEIKETQNINSNLNQITTNIGVRQTSQANTLIKKVQIPLKQYSDQFKNCLDILEYRKKLADKIHQMEIEIKQLKDDHERQNEAINLNVKLNQEKQRHSNFVSNFKYNEDYFKENVNFKIKELILEFNKIEKYGAQKLLNIWIGNH